MLDDVLEAQELFHFQIVGLIRNGVVFSFPFFHELGLLIRISMSSQVFQFLVCKDAHANAFNFMVHLTVDSRTSRADEDVEVDDAVHGSFLLAVEALLVFGELTERVHRICLGCSSHITG